MPGAIPNEFPVRFYPTPQIVDGLLYQTEDTRKGNWRARNPGEPHPDTKLYPGFVHVQTITVPNEYFVQTVWANDRTAENFHNAEKAYSEESNDHPVFRRTYIARRHASGRPLTKGTALSGVVGIRITNGGSGYTTAPTVAFTGGAGAGAAATAVVVAGAVVAVVMTSEGTGYTSAPTVGFTGGGGSSAAATAIVQPTTALLVKEEETRLQDSPLDGLYVLVTRIYETLPGPTLTGQYFDRERAHGAKADETVQRVLASSASIPDLSLTQLDARLEPVDSVVSRKILRSITSGGSQPILSGTHVDERTGIVIPYTKQFVAAGTAGSVTAADATYSKTITEIQPYDKWISIQIASKITLASLPAPFTHYHVMRHSFPDTLAPLAAYSDALLKLLINVDETELALVMDVVEGYSGPCPARTTERYLHGSSLTSYTPPAVVTFNPQSHVLSWLMGPNDHFISLSVPPTIHPEITVASGTSLEYDVPATDPTELPYGDYICVDVQPEEWRFGVWLVREIEVRVMPPP